jgi:outer membrane protein
MKKLLKVALIALSVVFVGNFAKAQSKIGYVNAQQLLEMLPEMKTLQTQMQAYEKTFSDQMTTMQGELQSKGQAYEKNQATMTDAARTAAQTELQDLQQRITTFRDNAQKQVDNKSQELLKPLSDKLKSAIQAVATEKGYAYVLDSGQIELLVAPPGDDLTAPVKAKLGLQ